MKNHTCKPGESWWVNDAQGIPLCRVCDECEAKKLARYRPEILTGYDQSDVDEDIEPDDSSVASDLGGWSDYEDWY